MDTAKTVQGVAVMCRACLREDRGEIYEGRVGTFRRLPAGWLQASGPGGEGRIVCSEACARRFAGPPPPRDTMCCSGAHTRSICDAHKETSALREGVDFSSSAS